MSTAVILTLTGVAALLYFAGQAQLHPFTRCESCGGKPPGDDQGNYHRCRTCGGASERLRFGAWIQHKMGIPVPRAKRSNKRHRMSL